MGDGAATATRAKSVNGSIVVPSRVLGGSNVKVTGLAQEIKVADMGATLIAQGSDDCRIGGRGAHLGLTAEQSVASKITIEDPFCPKLRTPSSRSKVINSRTWAGDWS